MLKKPAWLDWVRLYFLYLRAFPPMERKPFWMIRRMYRRGVTDVWCLRRDRQFFGLAITINSPDVILLDYFAIHPRFRGQGAGSEALAQLQQQYATKGFFVEIERTDIPVPDQPMRLRRKQFYLRSGLQEMHTVARLFGVEMELLGIRCHLDFDQYQSFYREYYSSWAADRIEPI